MVPIRNFIGSLPMNINLKRKKQVRMFESAMLSCCLCNGSFALVLQIMHCVTVTLNEAAAKISL